jgi:hypothetical protein
MPPDKRDDPVLKLWDAGIPGLPFPDPLQDECALDGECDVQAEEPDELVTALDTLDTIKRGQSAAESNQEPNPNKKPKWQGLVLES